MTAPAVGGRGAVPGLVTRMPLAGFAPPVLQEDGFAVALLAALDEVLAPVIGVLDSLDAYVDPSVAPPDFLAWVGEWLGLALTDDQPLPRRRALVQAAPDLYARRGTAEGMRRHLELLSGGSVTVKDSGGVVFSAAPRGELPGEATLSATVVVRGAGSTSRALLEAAVEASRPVHVRVALEVRP